MVNMNWKRQAPWRPPLPPLWGAMRISRLELLSSLMLLPELSDWARMIRRNLDWTFCKRLPWHKGP